MIPGIVSHLFRYCHTLSVNVHLRLLKANVEFVWWGWGGAFKVIFLSNPTALQVELGF